MTTIAYAALWIFVFTVPWENVVVVTGVGAISRLMGIIALGVAMLAVIVSGRMRRWHAAHIAALLFMVWGGANQLMFRLAEGLSNKYLTFVQLFFAMWIIWELALSWRRVRGLLAAYVAGAAVAAFETLRVYHRLSATSRRFAAEGFDANDLAMMLALALPMAWYLGMTYRHPLARWLSRGYLPLALVAIGLTGSRGGMLASVVALAFVPLGMLRLSPQRLATMLIVVGGSGVLAVGFLPDTVMKRLASTKSEVQGGDLNGRWKLWVAGTRAFAQRPVMGHGPGSFESVITPWVGSAAMVAHNSYLSVLVEEGLVGFFLLAGMIIAIILAVRRLPKLERRMCFVVLATLGVAMLPLTWEDRKAVWIILAMLLGLASARDVPAAAEESALPAGPSTRPTATPILPRGSRRPMPFRQPFRSSES